MWTLALALFSVAFGQTADEIVARARSANQVERSIQSVTMTIVGKGGSERVRKIELRSRRDDTSTASYIEVKSPADLAGTKLLDRESDGKEEQFLKLGSFPGVKRISGSGKRSSFLGSDFTYEDLAIREVAKGSHALVADEAQTWVIETIPADSPQYAKIRAHVSKADLVARKVEFFDKKDGALVKVLEVTETAKTGDTTLPRRTVMRNVQKDRRTELRVTEQRVDVPESELPAEVFTPEYLTR